MISPKKKYKIALIGYRFTEGGGEKVMANLSIFFDKVGIEVHNIIVLDGVTYSYAGKLVNMGLMKNESNDFSNKLKRLLFIRRYLKTNNFDFIIDFRPRTKSLQEFLIARFVYNAKTILTVHNFLLEYYMPKKAWLGRLIFNQVYATVTIVDKIKELVESKYNLTNVTNIFNPINLEEVFERSNEEIDITFDYVIAIGQYHDNLKQFDKLIWSYAHSNLPEKDIHLIILGKGNDIPLQKMAADNNVTKYIHLMGFENNPYKYLKKAKFLASSSLNEGMPNVILESLACETPVIAFDCPTGPREMIVDKQNGLLVENQNIQKLTEAMNLFVENEELYNYCKNNTLESIQKFSLDTIGKQWLDLMKIENSHDKKELWK
ncbi:glycosyltransferase [Flavobacterium hibisci]|uniref:glycosyltransferase n=1 Tax=Flavobacterium hibisci TaxID=1914462 RepID=UPI001CC09BEF|nr:glycosyltransferase [Flavobacterium hibisci]MBZ4042530.1 glycosyltransferase [Flavobacterium hibisci]